MNDPHARSSERPNFPDEALTADERRAARIRSYYGADAPVEPVHAVEHAALAKASKKRRDPRSSVGEALAVGAGAGIIIFVGYGIVLFLAAVGDLIH